LRNELHLYCSSIPSLVYNVKGDTPLKSPANRGSTPLDSPKGEKGIVTVSTAQSGEIKEGGIMIRGELKRGAVPLVQISHSPLKKRKSKAADKWGV